MLKRSCFSLFFLVQPWVLVACVSKFMHSKAKKTTINFGCVLRAMGMTCVYAHLCITHGILIFHTLSVTPSASELAASAKNIKMFQL